MRILITSPLFNSFLLNGRFRTQTLIRSDKSPLDCFLVEAGAVGKEFGTPTVKLGLGDTISVQVGPGLLWRGGHRGHRARQLTVMRRVIMIIIGINTRVASRFLKCSVIKS